MFAEFLCIKKQEAEYFNIQGTFSKVKKYLKDGYNIEERNGNWIIKKPSRLWVYVKYDNRNYALELRREAMEYSNVQKLTQRAIDRFEKALEDGKVLIKVLDDGSYELEIN